MVTKLVATTPKGAAYPTMRTVTEVIDSDLIVNVSEDFTKFLKGTRWGGIKEPAKLSTIQYVANEILQVVEYVMESPETITIKIWDAQRNAGSASIS